MYTYKISNDDTEKITDKTQKYSELLDDFKQVDQKYKPTTNDLILERKEFVKPSDDQIKKQATESLQGYKDKSLENIENNYNENSQKLDTKLDEAQKASETKKQEAGEMYSKLKQEASKDALKRGLARSSIVINVLDAFDQNYIKEINKINDEIQSKITSLQGQKSLLDEQRQSALNAFDINYALKLSSKIDNINKELLEQEQKVIEYNNQIAQKEADYQAKQKQSYTDYASFVQKYGTEALENIKREEKYELAKTYLMSMPKQEALKELEQNRTFNAELGANYYNKLKVLVNAKKED